MFWRATCVALACTIVACTGNLGNFAPDGFHHARHPYSLSYGDPEGQTLLGSDWRVDNSVGGNQSGQVNSKKGDDFEYDISIDTDEDGEVDRTIKDYIYDLRLEHKHSDAVIWIRTVPLAPSEAEKELRVLMTSYAEAVAGAGYYRVALSEGRKTVKERRFATKMLDQRPVAVSCKEGLMATIEVANVDQLKLSPESRWERARVVLVRPDYEWTRNHKDLTFPALMILGYSNLPQDFDRQLPDFEKLLSQLNLPTSGGACFVAPQQPKAPASKETSEGETNEAPTEEPHESDEPEEPHGSDESAEPEGETGETE